MRISRLSCTAFGPFTDFSLSFSSRDPGLHIIYGPNEAGKSSALRALKALLFGFPERTTDNFQHPSEKLLVAGTLLADDQGELVLQRRKKRKGDLLDAAGNPIPDDALGRLLHGMDRALFEALYGIDHQTLVQGGEDILAQQGALGQTLFAVGAGVAMLHDILAGLEQEADALFRPRGSKQKINQALRRYGEWNKKVRESSLAVSRWQEHSRRLRQAQGRLAELEEISRQKQAEIARLTRLGRVIPLLVRLRHLERQLLAMGEVVLLPDTAEEQLRALEQEVRVHSGELEKEELRLAKLQEKINALEVDEVVLAHAEPIIDLYQRLGEYRKGRQDMERLEGMRISHRSDAGGLLRQVRPDLELEKIEAVRPVVGRRRTLEELSRRHEGLQRQLQQAQLQEQEGLREEREIGAEEGALPPVADCAVLQQAVAQARKLGDIDQRLTVLDHACRALVDSGAAALAGLGLEGVGLERLLTIALPLAETIRRFERQLAAVADQRQRCRQELDQLQIESETVAAKFQAMRYAGQVPLEEDLSSARQQRQRGWQLLRRQWLNGEDISAEAEQYAGAASVVEVYERHVDQADLVADRLRREADRVAQLASLRAEQERLAGRRKRLAERRDQLAGEEERRKRQWQAVWHELPVVVGPPEEMLAWREAVEALRSRGEELVGKREEYRLLADQRRQHRLRLEQQLTALGGAIPCQGEELAPVLQQAETMLTVNEQVKNRRQHLQERLAQVRQKREKARLALGRVREELAQWQQEWQQAIAGLAAPDRQLQPAMALDLLEALTNCFAKVDKAAEFQKRIGGLRRDLAAFVDDAMAVATKVGLETKRLSPEQTVLQLHALLDRTRQAGELRHKMGQEGEELDLALAERRRLLARSEQELAVLLAAGHCATIDELRQAIARSTEYGRLRQQIDELQAAVVAESDGLPLADLEEQAAQVDLDQLPGRIEQLQREVDNEVLTQIKEVSQRIGTESRELALMDGDAQAADAADRREQEAARLTRYLRHYARLKLAAGILKREMERYRERHQDPVLRAAGDCFSRLTLGGFKGLRADLDTRGEPVLVGIRANGDRVPVAGMSSGTRDQLYLALRLASLEERLQAGEAMPFIVDDILINFDDARSRATLAVLADLARKNQILLFTHHHRIVAEAAELQAAGAEQVVVHTLPGTPSPG